MNLLRSRSRVLLSVFFLLITLFWLGMDSEVFARAGGGRSSGSFGSGSSRSYSRPASPPSQPSAAPQQTQPPIAPAGAGRSFFSGMAGGLMGGLLGGMLFRGLGMADSGAEGSGFGFGDFLLIMIILSIIYFVYKRFRSRNAMQMSTAGAGAYSYDQVSAPPALSAGTEDAKPEGLRYIREMDPSFNEKAFKDLSEDIFFKIQGAWTKRDLSNVRGLLSREMFDVFQRDVNRMLAEKQSNRLENIAVREVEIIEAGQDRGEEFVTARFYANLLDYTSDDKTGQIISGSSSDPVKFVEYWTFSRNVGEKNWVLAGIKQEGNN
jgi:predicted lipid-binding transport protein (Tim44 family)